MTMSHVTLGQVCELTRDPVGVEAEKNYQNVGLLNRGRGIFRKPDLQGSETKYSTLYRIRNGQLIYSKLFGWEGAVALVNQEFDGSFVSSEFPTFTLNKQRVLSAYLHHVVGWSGFAEQLSVSTSGLGQRRQRVNVSDFERLKIPLPGLAEQRCIAAHLDRLSLVAKTHNTARPHREALTQAVRNSLVQEGGGRRRALMDFLTLRPGEPVVDDARYRVTGVYSFGRGLLSRGVISGNDTKYKTLTAVRSGDVVYSKLGAFENAVAVVDQRFDGSFVSPEFPVFQPTDDVHPDFLRAALTTTSFAEKLASVSTGVGARQKRVSPGAFLALEMLVPEPKTQERVVEMLRRASRFEHLAQAGQALAEALVPAARNGIFSAMQ